MKRGSIPSGSWFKSHREGMKAGAALTMASQAWTGQANQIMLAAKNQLELELDTEGIYNPQDPLPTVCLYLPARLHIKKALNLPRQNLPSAGNQVFNPSPAFSCDDTKN